MEYKVNYNGQETNDFDTLASWFQELKDENERLKREYDIAQNHITENEDCIHSMSNDMNQVRNLNKSLENEISELKAEKRKTVEVLKRYCGDSVDAHIPTMVGWIIDDYFNQEAEIEYQVKALQKAEKTIEKLNKGHVKYADVIDGIYTKLCDLTNQCITNQHDDDPYYSEYVFKDEAINVMIDELFDDLLALKTENSKMDIRINELEEALKKDEKIIDDLNTDTVGYANKVADQREQIKELEKKVEKLEKRLWDPEWCQLIDKLNDMIDKEAPIPYACRKVYTNVEDEIWDKLNYLTRALCMRNTLNDVKDKRIRELENKVNELDVTNRKLKLDNEKLILVQGDSEIEHAVEITDLKKEIYALKKELEERKNRRSPRWPSDVMKIGTLENKVDKLTKENEYLKYKNQLILSEPCHGGLSIVAENHRLREEVESLKGQNEVLKIKNAYPICPIFEANSKEAANSIFGVNGTIHKLREENNKLKDALKFCQKEASSAREHAHNVEVNAERIRKGLD